MTHMKVVYGIVAIVLCFNGLEAVAIRSSGAKHQEEVFPCYVCEKGVEMTRDNIFASYSEIKNEMTSYCRSIYSQYLVNCLYIVDNYLLDIYTRAHVTTYSSQAICISEGLCPNKTHGSGIILSN